MTTRGIITGATLTTIAEQTRRITGATGSKTPSEIATLLTNYTPPSQANIESNRTYTASGSSTSSSPTSINPDSGYDAMAKVSLIVPAASSFSITGSDKTDALSASWSNSDGTYKISGKIKGTVSASTNGWFSSSGALTASSNSVVGTINQPTLSITTSSQSTSMNNLKTVTPSASTQYIIASTGGYFGSQDYITVSGDSDLTAGNIKSGVNIFGVTGTYTGAPTEYYTASGPVSNQDLYTSSHKYRYLTIPSASDVSITGSTVTDNVTIGSASSGYYPISAKIKCNISTSSAGWLSSRDDVEAASASQVGKIAAAAYTTSSSSNSGTSQAIITPSTADQYVNISAGYTPKSYIKVNGDSNLVAANIATGMTIFGVTGTHSGGVSGITYNSSTNKITINNDATPTYDYVINANGDEQTVTINNYSITSFTTNESSWSVETDDDGIPTFTFDEGTYYLQATEAPPTIYATNLSASNIKNGVTILGTTGTYGGSSMDLYQYNTVYSYSIVASQTSATTATSLASYTLSSYGTIGSTTYYQMGYYSWASDYVRFATGGGQILTNDSLIFLGNIKHFYRPSSTGTLTSSNVPVYLYMQNGNAYLLSTTNSIKTIYSTAAIGSMLIFVPAEDLYVFCNDSISSITFTSSLTYSSYSSSYYSHIYSSFDSKTNSSYRYKVQLPSEITTGYTYKYKVNYFSFRAQGAGATNILTAWLQSMTHPE